jgi:Domain of unknown function (DUF4112)
MANQVQVTKLPSAGPAHTSQVSAPATNVPPYPGIGPAATLIGLFPVVSDIITTALSLFIVHEAYQRGAPGHVIARMLGNVALDHVRRGAAGRRRLRRVVACEPAQLRLLREWLERGIPDDASARKFPTMAGQLAGSSSSFWLSGGFPKALALECAPVRIAHEPIEDGVGNGKVADDIVQMLSGRRRPRWMTSSSTALATHALDGEQHFLASSRAPMTTSNDIEWPCGRVIACWN